MKINKLFYFILLIYYGNASVVQDIDIIGNHHTKKHIIIREIHHQFPGEYNSTHAQEDRNRIYNLGLFSTVEIYKIDSTYTIFLVETFRFLPIPLLEYSESKGFSYGAGISYLNFRGLNEKLLLGGMIGEEEAYFFKIPCVTIRNNTERPQTVINGKNILSGYGPKNIIKCTSIALKKTQIDNKIFGTGNASSKIYNHIIYIYHLFYEL